jgi:hypothetical protein
MDRQSITLSPASAAFDWLLWEAKAEESAPISASAAPAADHAPGHPAGDPLSDAELRARERLAAEAWKLGDLEAESLASWSPERRQRAADERRREALLASARSAAAAHAERLGLRVIENPDPSTPLDAEAFVLFTPSLDEVSTSAGPLSVPDKPLGEGGHLGAVDAWAAMPRALRSADDPHAAALGVWLAQARWRSRHAGASAIVFHGLDAAEPEARHALRVALLGIESDLRSASRASAPQTAILPGANEDEIHPQKNSPAYIGSIEPHPDLAAE